jgi:hypothetical protein
METLLNKQSQTTAEVEPVSTAKKAIIMTSDPQYPWSPALDAGQYENAETTKSISKSLITAQYNDINAYTSTLTTATPMFINGDITAFGDDWQRETMKELIQIVSDKNPVYLGLGNCDYQDNVNQSDQNVAAVGMMNWYREFARSYPNIVSEDILVEEDGINNKYSQSFSYTVDLGDVVVIQLHNNPTYAASFTGKNAADDASPNYEYNIYGNMDWLKEQLIWATDRAKAILINMHYPYDWAGGPSDEFRLLTGAYPVTAIFAGHFHSSAGIQNNAVYQHGNTPIFLSGSASQSSYLIVEYDAESVDVYLVSDNDHTKKTLLKSVMVYMRNNDWLGISWFTWGICNLYRNRMIDLNEETSEKTPQFYSWTGGTNQQFTFSYNKAKDLYQISSVRYPAMALAIVDSTVKLVPNYEESSWLKINYMVKYYTDVDGKPVEFFVVYFISTADSSLYMTYDPGYSDGREILGVSTEPVPFKLILDFTHAPIPGPNQEFEMDPLGIAAQVVVLTSLYGKLVVDLNESVSDKKPELFTWTGGTNQQFRIFYYSNRQAYQLYSVRYPRKSLAINRTTNEIYLASFADALLNDDTFFKIDYLETYDVIIDGVKRRFHDVYNIRSLENKSLNYDQYHSDQDRTLWAANSTPYRVLFDLSTPPTQGGIIID